LPAGKLKFVVENPMRAILLVIQITIAIATLVGALHIERRLAVLVARETACDAPVQELGDMTRRASYARHDGRN
jgi:hypothetical protein